MTIAKTLWDPAWTAAGYGLVIGAAFAPDIDDAFDAVKDADIERFGTHETATLSLAHFDAGDALALSEPPTALGSAVAAALARGELLEPGQLYALPLTQDRRFSRRRVRLTSDDTTVALPDTPQILFAHPAALVSHLDALLLAAGDERQPEEFYDTVELVRVRARYKPTVTRHTGPSLRRHAVIDSEGNIVHLAKSSSEARRYALESVRAGEGHLEVHALGSRGPESAPLPLIEVDKTLVARKSSFKVSLLVAKTPDLPCDGWLFVGRPPTSSLH